jgi:hypothetical protein
MILGTVSFDIGAHTCYNNNVQLGTNFSKEQLMTTQTFKVVGITEHNGNVKVRFTHDMVRRVKQFSKGGATRIDFVELPTEMNKIDALKYMLTCKEFSSEDDQATIQDTLEDKIKEFSKGEVKVKAKPSLDAIKNRPRKDVSVNDILEAVNG